MDSGRLKCGGGDHHPLCQFEIQDWSDMGKVIIPFSKVMKIPDGSLSKPASAILHARLGIVSIMAFGLPAISVQLAK